VKLDARLWATLWPLLSRPGFLTVEYLAGRRMRYLSPLKLYLSLAFVYFLVFGWLSQPLVKELQAIPLQSASVQITRPGAVRETSATTRRKERVVRRLKTATEWQFANQNTINLFLIPVFAAALSLVLRKQRKLYMEHVIFLLHTQAATYLLALPCTVLFRSAAGMIASLLPAVIYYPLAFRRVYGPLSWPRTIGILLLYSLLCLIFMYAVTLPAMFVYMFWPWGG